MQFHSLRLRGMTEAFRSEVLLDIDGLGPGLVAIVGENGAGKSTLIGSLFASLFRQFPAQKRPLYDFATCADPEIDVTFSVQGRRFRSLVKIDPRARQMESYLFAGDGTPLTNGKKEPFQEMIERLVGSRALYEASIFSNQKRAGNFLSLERAQRKELLVEQLLGLGRLRHICELARARHDEQKQTVAVLEGELRGLESAQAQQADLPDAASVEQALEEVSSDLFGKEAQLEEAQQTLADAQRLMGGLAPLERSVAELEQRASALTNQITSTRKEVREDESFLQNVPPLNGEQDHLTTVGHTIVELQEKLQKTQQLENTNRDCESALRVAQVELSNKQRERERLETEHRELAQVPCRGEGEYAACPKIRRALESGKLLPVLVTSIASLEQERKRHDSGRVPVPVTSTELMRRLQNAEGERRKLEAFLRRRQEATAVEARLQERRKTALRLTEEQREVEQTRGRLHTEIESMAPLRAALAKAELELKRVTAELRALQSRREQLLTQQAQIERAEQHRKFTQDKVLQTREQLASERQERDDWAGLAKAFGPDEIQLLEIQSAGPAISEIVNGLLECCLDNKFEVRFRTQRPKADGRGFTDDLDVEVRNKLLDRCFTVDELSGGQFVLVNEALNLGIAMYNAQKGEGVSYGTLFRDETIGALDQHNGTEYIRMLRRAMELGGFHQVIFITHNPGVWELADRVVHVANGTITIDDRPSQETERPLFTMDGGHAGRTH